MEASFSGSLMVGGSLIRSILKGGEFIMYAAVVGTQLTGAILGMKTPVGYDTIHAGDWRIGLVVSWCHLVVILDLCRAYTVSRCWTTQP